MKYSTPEIDIIFSEEMTLKMWHLIEVAVLGAQAAADLVPVEWWRELAALRAPDVLEWKAAELETGHEVVAFLHAMNADHIHIGLTSSDLTDTALAMKVQMANEHILVAWAEVIDVMDGLIGKYGATPYLARTHGQPAVPDRFGRRMDVLMSAVGRCGQLPDIPGKISGPVGSFGSRAVTKEIERQVLEVFSLTCTCPGASHHPECSQIVPRDYHSRWAWAVADLVSAYAAVAMDVRLLAHSQVGEVSEGRGSGYVGSSAMPHKRNPNQSERMTGLARMARTMALAVSEGIEQWHDRDLAHSSVEREFIPALAGIAHYAGLQMVEILTNLQIHDEVMWSNLMAHYDEATTHDRMVELQLGGMPYKQAAKAAVNTKEENND